MDGDPTRPVFVGRSAALAELGAAIRRADAGRGALLVVRGEAGVGKTRLVERAVEAVPAPMAVGWSRARESGSPPLWIWTQLGRQLRRHGLDLPLTPGGAAPGPAERFERFDAIGRALAAGSENHPVALVIDDLQWVDRDSLELLGFVAADLTRQRVAIVATVRTGEGDERRLAHELAGLQPHVIELGGMDDAEVAELVDALAGAPPPPAVLDALRRHTAGNPLFVSELARLLRSAGRAADVAAWRGVLPDGVRAVLGRRLARLPQRSHQLLGEAASSMSRTDMVSILLATLDTLISASSSSFSSRW